MNNIRSNVKLIIWSVIEEISFSSVFFCNLKVEVCVCVCVCVCACVRVCVERWGVMVEEEV